MGNRLTAILDSLPETGIFVMEKKGTNLLYYNRRIKEVCQETEAGIDCGVVWKAVYGDSLFPDDAETGHKICYNTKFGRSTDVIAHEIMWDADTPAVAVVVIPHKSDYEERQGHEQIEKLYMSSLVTVFDECIIANLTADFYVNCQRDIMWTDIPELGEFDRENKKYSGLTVHPDDIEIFNASFSRDAMIRIFGEGKNRICKRLRRMMGDGVYHMVEFTAARIEQFSDECWCVLVYQDIQDEYMLEQKRNVEISQLATAAEVAYQMLISVNLTRNMYNIMGYEKSDITYAPDTGNFDQLVESGAAAVDSVFREEFLRKYSRKPLLEAFDKGVRNVSMELRRMGDDGQFHWIFIQAVRVDSPYTEDVMEITMIKNIDEERRIQEEYLEKERKAKLILEEALEKAEAANRAKGDFLSKMSHDIRTPMNAIMGMTCLAQHHLNDPDKLSEYLEKIEISSAHLLGLINEVLDMSKIENGKMELTEFKFDLCQLLQDVVLMVQPDIQKRRQKISVEIAKEIHSQVLGDGQRLRQVLVNVLENASKYTQPEGRISISLAELEEAESNMGTYRFVIEDTGIGIKKEFLNHIFEPFSRADDSRISKTAGTGLGLTIVRNVVHMMGGEIQVESEYGKGSRFTITLLFEKKNGGLPAEKKEGQELTDQFCDLKILLVEDNELNQQIAKEMLTILGPEVEVAENGQEALEMILRNPPFYYDLIYMDIQMPVMDGFEAAERIRNSGKERIKELPIIAMTANAFAEDVKKTKISGMNGHLSKPIDMDQLRKSLVQCVYWKRKNLKEDNFYYEEESLEN